MRDFCSQPPTRLLSPILSLPMEGEARRPFRVFFFPLVSPGHMIPMIDMAKLFARRGVATTVITTPGNEPLARPAIDRANAASAASRPPIELLLLPFPSSVVHLLPHGRENLAFVSSSDFNNLIIAVFALQEPLGHLLRERRPDCLVSDALYTWSADLAEELGIPRIVFHGPGLFSLCVHRSIELHETHKNVGDDSEIFVVEGLPHRVEMTRSELSEIFQVPQFLAEMGEAEKKSYGIVVNSFYELEPDYAKLYKKWPGRRAWYLGPLSLCNQDSLEMADRGQHASHPDLARWLSWLDCKPASSVVYVCFGSLCEHSNDQLHEIALGLEASPHPFFWVVRDEGNVESEWMPEGFKKRVEGRGIVVRGWAPQVLILGHPAVGCFVTHCGWNSTLEAVSAAVPMATWPLAHEQFVNEKLITQALGIGVTVERERQGVVKREKIAEAVVSIIGGGEEVETVRKNVREYAAKAKAAMEEGGSSYVDLSRLIDELLSRRAVLGTRKEGNLTAPTDEI